MATETGTDQRKASPTPEANEAPGRQSFEVVNPADHAVIATVPLDGPERVREVAARVRVRQPQWEGLGIEGRRQWLERLRDWLLDHQDEIAELMQSETGKVRADAAAETPYLADLINFYGANAKKFIGEQRVSAHSVPLKLKRLRVQFRPYPLVGVISPWNFPILIALGDALPALQAGCAVVIKPSEVTPLTVRRIVEAWKSEIGGPDVLDVVNGMADTGSALIDEADFVQFTGSERTGKKVMARAAETLTPVSLELGGKDPMIVLRSADLERASNAAAWGAFVNAGQACTSIERIYVEADVYGEFVRRLSDEVATLRRGVGDLEHDSEIGAITFPPQLETVEEHVSEAKQKGASVLTGGKREPGPGNWYPPTVIADADPSMKVMREETFGPVVAVMKVRDGEEALRLANDTRYGLSGAVFGATADAEALARRLEVGSVNVNDVLISTLATDIPMGGWKQSGIGFRNGEEGIKKFVRPESLAITRFGSKREPLYYPYSRRRRWALRRITQFFAARDWRRRLGRR
jgi:acyl-CoA reductase-like NAD-dependent aldehyde dehydrogenase